MVDVVVDGQSEVDRLLNRIAALEERNRMLTSENKDLRRRLGKRDEMVRQVAAVVQTEQPPKLMYRREPRKHRPRVHPVFLLGDWHIGEKAERDATGGFGEYNWGVTQKSHGVILNSFLKWVYNYRSIYLIEDCTVMCLGDWISGDIHDELRVTNEFPVPVQIAHAGQLLGQTIRTLSSEFKKVKVVEVGGGNHDRVTRRPQHKQRCTNSYSYLVYAIANEMNQGNSRVEIDYSDDPKRIVKVGNTRFLVEHGDAVRAWGAYPAYGWERMLGREALRRMDESAQRFDYWVIGHWHTPTFYMDMIIINGALTPTTEYIHLKGRRTRPAQTAFLVSEKHGPFDFTFFRV
ncbi:MAG: hypothetical protein DRP85_09485 [Candidatus Makaraimicrobium thalassicum]|nr:MAG: hypothetical protein DRP85_09485 [Candidatus Omnitrophota bacterium]